MTTIPYSCDPKDDPWVLPDKGVVGMWSLITAEAAMFSIFVVAYIFYLGKSLSGPSPKDVLEPPIFITICLLSSSITVHMSAIALRKRSQRGFIGWLALTITLGVIFLLGTAREWHDLIFNRGLSIRTNMFGTTFYSLVGLHATHVVVGLLMLTVVLVLGLMGKVRESNYHHFHALSLYWHFVDAVWVVVFSVVYLFGR
jgi:cytochrome c oxidase subunit 3/cytochrome o ubiquinol oxidase subunit 3